MFWLAILNVIFDHYKNSKSNNAKTDEQEECLFFWSQIDQIII